MESLEEKIRSQYQEIEALEKEKQKVTQHLAIHKDKSPALCERLKQKMERINKKIEEVYSQISLLKIRNMMGLF